MKRLLDWIVSKPRMRWSFRIAMLALLMTMVWTYYGFQSMQKEFAKRIQVQSEMWILEHEVYMLREITQDSMLENSKTEAYKNMLPGWIGFAKWSERLRSRAQAEEIDMDWKVETLSEVPATDGKVVRIPVSIKMMPFDRSYEKVLRFVERISKDSNQVWAIDGLSFDGDGDYMTDNRILINGWMLQ